MPINWCTWPTGGWLLIVKLFFCNRKMDGDKFVMVLWRNTVKLWKNILDSHMKCCWLVSGKNAVWTSKAETHKNCQYSSSVRSNAFERPQVLISIWVYLQEKSMSLSETNQAYEMLCSRKDILFVPVTFLWDWVRSSQ